ncbi:MAG: PepSY domain-containing protein [Xanthomonadales bacterium]|nr:PepSY domain-containing protein [Xanthomonadales bacterium]
MTAIRSLLFVCLAAFAVMAARAEAERSPRASATTESEPAPAATSPGPARSRYDREAYRPSEPVIVRPATPARYDARAQRVEALRNRYPMPREVSRDMHQAIEQAQRTHGGKVLSADRLRNEGRDVYRVKLLTPGGRVRVVQLTPIEPTAAPESREQQGEQ